MRRVEKQERKKRGRGYFRSTNCENVIRFTKIHTHCLRTFVQFVQRCRRNKMRLSAYEYTAFNESWIHCLTGWRNAELARGIGCLRGKHASLLLWNLHFSFLLCLDRPAELHNILTYLFPSSRSRTVSCKFQQSFLCAAGTGRPSLHNPNAQEK